MFFNIEKQMHFSRSFGIGGKHPFLLIGTGILDLLLSLRILTIRIRNSDIGLIDQKGASDLYVLVNRLTKFKRQGSYGKY